ncbi:AraC family transcriptional regulator [Pseudomonas sp. M47T1]|uniref:AraC family transcriptional regulator n=1 Tax=unclassified Pseudomonas TaxID=196821 RepID=UPI0002607B91|nr:AraC family transcriptional regulator [Pseudomonas sp. M47T1]EIK94086.1 AraC family transcriptional regulator [Pseudomonas sp. M47T1]
MILPISQFWRDPALPFIEARNVLDGRSISHGLHSHSTFSIGAITGGHSTYINGVHQRPVRQGDLVLMNPGEVHACNPVQDQPWAYRMLYIDAQWLAALQVRTGTGDGHRLWPLAQQYNADSLLFQGLNELYETLVDHDLSVAQKTQSTNAFCAAMLTTVGTRPAPPALTEPVVRAADFIRAECARTLKLDEICAAAGLSSSYLIRAFKQRYGMTPHAFLIDCRLQAAREKLRQGHDIAEAALAAGFADQAHLQRVFKRQLAATPGHYRAQPATR